MNRKSLYTFIILIFVIIGIIYFSKTQAPVNNNPINLNDTSSTSSTVNIAPTTTRSILSEPIKDAKSRVSKKPFGIKISPTNSPVSPEKFSGYHTGVDFETTQDEQNIDVPVYAICDGNLLLKKYATGYGGVAVQSCLINSENVTIIYGHLNLDSIILKVNEKLVVGEKLGILGKGYSNETSGERKHLHLGMHKGTSVNILGYVQNQQDLNSWLDIMKLL